MEVLRGTETAPESGATESVRGGSTSGLPPGGGSFLAQPANASASKAAPSRRRPARELTGYSESGQDS